MLVEFSFDYSFLRKSKDDDEEAKIRYEKDLKNYQHLQPHLIGAPVNADDVCVFNHYKGDLTLIMSVMTEIRVHRAIETNGFLESANTLITKIDKLSQNNLFNQKCSVHAPGNSLLHINDITPVSYTHLTLPTIYTA